LYDFASILLLAEQLHFNKQIKMKNSICMSCKFFSMKNSTVGTCRVLRRESGNKNAPRPEVQITQTCEKWQDCGQQYYVRKGWLKAQEKRV
jgi:hypothetical protein